MDYRREDKLAIEVYNQLRSEYNVLTEQVGPYGNIIGIFMHELMIYFSNYILISMSRYDYPQKVDMPYLNSEFCQAPYLVENLDNMRSTIRATKIRHRGVSAIIKLRNLIHTFFPTKTSVAIMYPELFSALSILRMPFNVRIDQLNNSKIHLKNVALQIEVLQKTMIGICEKLSIPNQVLFTKNFLNYIRQYISPEPIACTADFLIVGSNSYLRYRTNSANYLQNGKRVISFAHGHGCAFLLDDPYIGYGEFSYCNYYFTYGSFKLDYGSFNRPLTHPPLIIQRTSKVIDSFYKPSSPLRIIQRYDDLKILYIPTGFSKNVRYGPFRDLDDQVYMEWQKAILAWNENVYIKSYPGQEKYYELDASRFILGNMMNNLDILETFDLIIIDYFSTIANLVASSTTQVLYLNRGLMNINPSALEVFKERVIWHDIDLEKTWPNQIDDGYKKVFSEQHQKKKNYTEQFNLNARAKPEHVLIREVIMSD